MSMQELPFEPDAPAPPRVEVIRSAKRRKTVQARLVDGVVQIHIPAWMSKTEEHETVERMVTRVLRQTEASEIDLEARASSLAAKHGLPLPVSIRWVTNQGTQWGSCTPVDGTIRISDRLVGYPQWVIDAVVVHELAHLVVRAHNAEFYELCNRYPLTERAKGFLIAKGWGDDV
jgi:predicted metal-dependent hydrolase